ncbi:MAG: hypothetical protein U1E47_00630 [Rivihabitans pingtungensis]
MLGSITFWPAFSLLFLILSLAALARNILTGYAGQLSLGSAAFMAVGPSLRTTRRSASPAFRCCWRWCWAA